MTPKYRNPISTFFKETSAGIAYICTLAIPIFLSIVLAPLLMIKGELNSSELREKLNPFQEDKAIELIAALIALWVTILAIDRIKDGRQTTLNEFIQAEQTRLHQEWVYGIGSAVATILALTQLFGTFPTGTLNPIVLITIVALETLAVFATLFLRTDLWSEDRQQKFYFLKTVDQLALISCTFNPKQENTPHPEFSPKESAGTQSSNSRALRAQNRTSIRQDSKLGLSVRATFWSCLEFIESNRIYTLLPLIFIESTSAILSLAIPFAAVALIEVYLIIAWIIPLIASVKQDPLYPLRGLRDDIPFPWRAFHSIVLRAASLFFILEMLSSVLDFIETVRLATTRNPGLPPFRHLLIVFLTQGIILTLLTANLILFSIYICWKLPEKPFQLTIRDRNFEASALIARLRRLQDYLANGDQVPGKLLEERIQQFKIVPVKHDWQATLKPQLQPYYRAKSTAPFMEDEVSLEGHLLLFTQYLDPRLTTLKSLLEEPPEGAEDASEASTEEPVA